MTRTHGSRTRRGAPKAYDFRRPTKLSREHVRVLGTAEEAFARQATTVLSSMLRTGARLDLDDIEQLSYEDHIAALPNPTFLAAFHLDPLPGKGLLSFPLECAMACVDHMVGGSGGGTQPTRAFTSMESSLVRHLLTRLLRELSSAFAPVTRLVPEVDALEYNPQLAQTSSASETVMVGRFTLRIGLREAPATLCLPFTSFASALTTAASPQLSASDRRKRETATEALAERLTEVPVGVAVRFAPMTVPSRELVSLSVGDVIPLRHPRSSPLEVTTNDVIFAWAVTGNHRNRLACQIVPAPPRQEGHPA